MDSMNASGDFLKMWNQKFCGKLSHVSSQLVMIPSSRSLLSRDKRLPLDTWNQSGLQENFLGNQFSTFDSPRNLPQRIPSDNVQRNREAVPEAGRTKTIHTSEDRLNQGTIPMPTFATKPSTTSSTMPMELPQNFLVGQRRHQISKLQFDEVPNPQSFSVWKSQFKTQVTTCSDFQSDATLWIKEVEMVDSLDELKSSRSFYGKDFPNFEMPDAKIASAHQNSQCKKKFSLEEQKAQKEDRFLRGRQIAFMWRSRCSVTRQERGDLCGIDHHPVKVSSKQVEWQARRDLCSSGTPEEQLLTKPTKNPKPKKTKTTI